MSRGDHRRPCFWSRSNIVNTKRHLPPTERRIAIQAAGASVATDHHILALARLLGRLTARDALAQPGQCNLDG